MFGQIKLDTPQSKWVNYTPESTPTGTQMHSCVTDQDRNFTDEHHSKILRSLSRHTFSSKISGILKILSSVWKNIEIKNVVTLSLFASNDGSQSIPWDSKDNDAAAMLVLHTIEIN